MRPIRPPFGEEPPGGSATALIRAAILLLAAALPGCGDGEEAASSSSGKSPSGSSAGLPPAQPDQPKSGPLHFVDVARPAGIDFRSKAGTAQKRWLPETIGQGVLLFDYDNDGDLDLYFANGGELQKESDQVCTNALFRNDGDWKFTNVTAGSGLECPSWSSGVYSVDFDADGFDDVYVTGFGDCRFFRNLGGTGRFSEVRIGGEAPGYSASAAFFDADQDGDLDLYVCTYVVFDPKNPPNGGRPCEWKNLSVCCGPRGLDEAIDQFYEFIDGRYVEATEKFGFVLKDSKGRRKGSYSLGAVAADFDGDGDADLYVSVDSRPNLMWENLGGGKFQQVAQSWQVAVNANGLEQAGMGVHAADIDGDGWTDIFVTNFSHDTNTLYLNAGNPANMYFDDATTRTGLGGEASFPWLSWGTAIHDFDCDGRLDIFVASGHVYPQAEGVVDLGTTYAQRNQLFMQVGPMKFADRAKEAGPHFADRRVSRGASFADLDRDGRMDVVVTNIDDWPSLVRNESDVKGGFLGIELAAANPANRHAIGAKVRLAVLGGGREFIQREVLGGGSYMGGNDPALHFGLAEGETVKHAVVTWPDQKSETFDVRAGAWQRLEQGRGR